MEWNDYFMNMAATVSLKSKDSLTKIGAVIIAPDKSVRSTGYNGFPRKVIDNMDDKRLYRMGFPRDVPDENKIKECEKRLERPLKYMFTAHAECNAICQAAKSGTHINECSIYVNGLPPCSSCACMIIQAGIIKVYYTMNEISEKWKTETDVAFQMFQEAGVKTEWMNVVKS